MPLPSRDGMTRPGSNKRTESWCAAWWATVAWRGRSSWSGSASSMPRRGCSPTSSSRRPSGFRLRRATVERDVARVGATTNRSPQRIGCCVGVASAEGTANALRRCSSNGIRWTCWRRFACCGGRANLPSAETGMFQSALTALGWIPCSQASRRCNGWSRSTLVCISAACARFRGGWVSGALPMPNRWLASR